jgi:hypothetical protein
VSRRAEATELLDRVLDMLARDGDVRWRAVLSPAIEALRDATLRDDDALEIAGATLSGAYRAPHDGFADWFIWRDDATERRRINLEFDELRRQLLRTLGLGSTGDPRLA